MRKSSHVSLFAMAFCLAASPAWASFTALRSMGVTVVQADLSCTTPKAPQVVCAARSLENTLVVNHFTGVGWTGWKTLPGAQVVVTSNPSCADNGAGEAVCAARGTTSGLVATVFNGKAFGAPIAAAGVILSAPSCAALKLGKVVCVADSAGGGLTYSVFNGTAWSAFKNVPTVLTAYSAAGCAPDRQGNAICAFLAPDPNSSNNIYVFAIRFNGVAWTPAIDLQPGFVTLEEPSCTEFGFPGQVLCIVRGASNGTFVNTFHGGFWGISNWNSSGWQGLGGELESKATCGLIGANQVVCGSRGTFDGNLYANTFNPTTNQWTGWLLVDQPTSPPSPVPFFATPACTKLVAPATGTGRALCAIIDRTNQGQSIIGP